MKNNKITLLITILLISLSSFVVVMSLSKYRNENVKLSQMVKEQKNYIDNFKEFSNINSDGSFVLAYSNGKYFVSKDYGKYKNDTRLFDWYFDPYCPDCIKLHEDGHAVIELLQMKEKLVLRYHPLNFTSKKQVNDYSLIANSWIIGLAENEPDLVVPFMNKIMTTDFRNKVKIATGNKEVNILINEVLNKLDVPSKTIAKIKTNMLKYEYAINRGSVNIRRDENLTKRSHKPEKTFFTPYIIESTNDNQALNGETENVIEDVLKPMGATDSDCSAACE